MSEDWPWRRSGCPAGSMPLRLVHHEGRQASATLTGAARGRAPGCAHAHDSCRAPRPSLIYWALRPNRWRVSSAMRADSYFTRRRAGTGIQQNDLPLYRKRVGAVDGFIMGCSLWRDEPQRRGDLSTSARARSTDLGQRIKAASLTAAFQRYSQHQSR
jgi:hypothetical protein